MTPVRAVLRHRARVRRGTSAMVDGRSVTTWDDVAENVPVLLDAGKPQLEPTYTAVQQQTADRSGVLFALRGAPIKPGDRVTLTRGATGTFLIKPDPAQQNFLSGPSHSEFRVEEVPS